MIRTIALALALVGFGACKKDEKPAPKAAPVAATVNADGSRTIPIEVNADGYTPDKIPGKPGEKLKLVFTRTKDSSCISQLKMADGKLIDLPMNQPVEVPVTVPQTGEVAFACGMDMIHGAVVAQPAS